MWLRRAFFQAHLWSGIALGLYIFLISVTGSTLVYWNELYRAATPQPIVSKGPGPALLTASSPPPPSARIPAIAWSKSAVRGILIRPSPSTFSAAIG